MIKMNQKEIDIQILQELFENAEGKLCSRYVLGLERAIESLKAGSSENALSEQKNWFKTIQEAKREKLKK